MKIVKCPECSKEFEYQSSESRPFCSEKCKMIDLGGWLSESYSIRSSEPLNEEDIETLLRDQLEEEDY